MGALRNSFAVILVIIGAFLSLPASVALWEQRTLAREERFVQLGQDIIDEPEVQSGIARALTDQLRKVSGISTITISNAKFKIDDIVLESVKALADSEAGNTALRGTYQVSRRLADLDDKTVQVEGDDLVIDLKPTVRRVVDDMVKDEPALQGVSIPDEVGLITVTNGKDAGRALDAWRAVDTAAPVLIVLPLIPFAVALLVASGRGFILFLIGASVAGGAAVSIFFLRGPVDSLIEDLITGDSVYGDAGFATYGRIVASYTSQQVVVLVGGVVVAATGLMTSVLFARR